jgi:type VI secretion system protein ImpF
VSYSVRSFSRPEPASLQREPAYGARASLLDRLTQERSASAGGTPAGVQTLRRSVLRDLAWLLNSTSLESTQSLDGFDRVRRSVVNYGLPALAGSGAGAVDPTQIERHLREAIVRFEPRIAADSIEVRCAAPSPGDPSTTALAIQITARLIASGTQQDMTFRGSLDREDGKITLSMPGAN